MRITKQVATALLIASGLTAFAFGKKKDAVHHAPLPAMVLTAKTIYIENETDTQAVVDKAYTQLMKWGKYKVVNTKEKADLVLVLTLAHTQTERQVAGWASLYNSATGTYTSGTVPGGNSDIHMELHADEANRSQNERNFMGRRKGLGKAFCNGMVDSLSPPARR